MSDIFSERAVLRQLPQPAILRQRLLSNYGYGDGVYAKRSYITGRPTLLPRYYGGW